MFEKNDSLKVNFVDGQEERRARRQTYIVAGVFVFLVGMLAGIGASISYRAVHPDTRWLPSIDRVPVLGSFQRLVSGLSSSKNSEISKDQFTLLLLGVGGEGHTGSQLSDTILLTSVDLKTKRLAFTSIPRDLAYPLGEGRFEKINAINAYAERDYPGEGAARTAEALEKLFETNIDHVIRIDFQGFADFINALGGVDIDVPQSFTDPQYPTADEKWTTISFKKGPQHMDGATALMYVRSRHGNNGEGSDFARSRRQQQVLLAIRHKLLSGDVLGSPSRVASLYTLVSKHIQTDLTPWDILKLAPRLSDVTWSQIVHRQLTDAPEGELVAATVNGAYMLFPRKPDWSDVRLIIKDPFNQPVGAPPQKITTDIARIEIKNGTTRTGFASQIAANLEKQGFEVLSFGNASKRGVERSAIYDLTKGKKPQSLAALRKYLDAGVVVSDAALPEKTLSPNVDFLVILGEASYGLVAR